MIRAPGRDGSCKANTGQGNSGARWCLKKRVAGSLFLLLLFLGVGNIYSAAQSADEILIQIVDDFNKATPNVYAEKFDLAAAGLRCLPFLAKQIKGRTDAKDLCVLDTDDVPFWA